MTELFSLIGGLCSLGDMGFFGNLVFGGSLTIVTGLNDGVFVNNLTGGVPNGKCRGGSIQ